jgi:hypothetical protein
MSNSFLRILIRLYFNFLYLLIQIDQAKTRKYARKNWEAIPLPDHEIEDYEAQKERLKNNFENMKGKKWWVLTSGTRKEPKKVPFNKERLHEVHKSFLKSMIVLTSDFPGAKTFFAFGALKTDDSLTSSMISDEMKPGHLELLQAPYRYLTTPEGKGLRNNIGDLAARVAILVLTLPRFVYATNPSTLTHFIDELHTHWPMVKLKIKELLNSQNLLKPLLTIQEGNGLKRLQSITQSDFNLERIFPQLLAVITWDGGYVRTFLNRLMEILPKGVMHLPMYSMSTETIETLPHKFNNRIVFLPTMNKTRPEFLDSDGKLLNPHELIPGMVYSLIITNEWGFERYDTQDEFQVVEMIDHLPHLIFLRRRNITASVTGEKLTESQVRLMQELLLEKFPILGNATLCLFPIIENNNIRYQLAMIGQTEDLSDLLTSEAEAILFEINTEYRDKVQSGRLLPMVGKAMTVKELALMMGQENSWESQFKVMPLYEKPVTKNS